MMVHQTLTEASKNLILIVVSQMKIMERVMMKIGITGMAPTMTPLRATECATHTSLCTNLAVTIRRSARSLTLMTIILAARMMQLRTFASLKMEQLVITI